MFDSPMAARVQAGVAWLNENMPDWRTTVSLERLDVRSYMRCVLSQVSGMNYYEASDKYHLGLQDRIDLGFTIDIHTPSSTTRIVLWHQLQQLWLEELTK